MGNWGKKCKSEGCTSGAVKGGIYVVHGAKTKRCGNEGCANRAVKGGVCVTHGARVKSCSKKGCTIGAIKGGVCVPQATTRPWLLSRVPSPEAICKLT